VAGAGNEVKLNKKGNDANQKWMKITQRLGDAEVFELKNVGSGNFLECRTEFMVIKNFKAPWEGNW